jgi:hypothetical protein
VQLAKTIEGRVSSRLRLGQSPQPNRSFSVPPPFTEGSTGFPIVGDSVFSSGLELLQAGRGKSRTLPKRTVGDVFADRYRTMEARQGSLSCQRAKLHDSSDRSNSVRLGIAFVVASGLGVVLSAQTPDTLDLTQVRPSSGPMTAGPATGPATGFSAHTKREESPVKLTVEWMDRYGYRDNNSFVFRLAIVNVSAVPVTLPWEPNPDRVGYDSDALRAVITIDARMNDREFAVPIAVLYGSKADSNTTKVLRPGARAEIIARGKWRLAADSSSPSAKIDFPAEVDVSGRIIFASSIDRHAYKDATSTNRMRVVVDRPDRQ